MFVWLKCRPLTLPVTVELVAVWRKEIVAVRCFAASAAAIRTMPILRRHETFATSSWGQYRCPMPKFTMSKRELTIRFGKGRSPAGKGRVEGKVPTDRESLRRTGKGTGVRENVPREREGATSGIRHVASQRTASMRGSGAATGRTSVQVSHSLQLTRPPHRLLTHQ